MDKGPIVTERDVLQFAAQCRNMTTEGGDFLFQPINPGAIGVTELRDGGQERLWKD